MNWITITGIAITMLICVYLAGKKKRHDISLKTAKMVICSFYGEIVHSRCLSASEWIEPTVELLAAKLSNTAGIGRCMSLTRPQAELIVSQLQAAQAILGKEKSQ